MSHEYENLIGIESSTPYSSEIRKLFEKLKITPISHLGDGTINHAWLTTNLETGLKTVLVVGPQLTQVDLKSRTDSGYLDAHKFLKAQQAAQAVVGLGVPAVQFLQAGIVDTPRARFAWGLEEVAKGQSLDKYWSDMSTAEKLTISNQLGTLMGKWHTITSLPAVRSTETAQEWYQRRAVDLLADGIRLGVFTPLRAQNIMSSFQYVLNSLKINNTMGLIHGDLFQANVFVDTNDPTEITHIIDWETATIGHIGYEQVLSAWWFAEEHGGNQEVFDTMISSSASRGVGLGFTESDLYPAVALVDMFWHLNVIVSCTALHHTTDVPRWLDELDPLVSQPAIFNTYADLSH